MGKRDRGSIGRFFVLTLTAIFICGLAAAVLYLLSEINHRQYRLATVNDALVVERGRFMPFGFERFEPDTQTLREAYATITIPPGQRVNQAETFADRADMDRALFALLAGWARQRLDATNPETVALTVAYIQRCAILPGVSEEQRQELKRLRGGLAFRNGERMVNEAHARLLAAVDEFELAVRLGTPNAAGARHMITVLKQQLRNWDQQPSLFEAQTSLDGAPRGKTSRRGTGEPHLELQRPELNGGLDAGSGSEFGPPAREKPNPQEPEGDGTGKWRL